MPALKPEERLQEQRAQVVYLTPQPPQAVELLSGFPDLLRPCHIAEILGVSEHTARSLCRTGQLPAVKIGAFWYVSKGQFLNHMEVKNDRLNQS